MGTNSSILMCDLIFININFYFSISQSINNYNFNLNYYFSIRKIVVLKQTNLLSIYLNSTFFLYQLNKILNSIKTYYINKTKSITIKKIFKFI